MRTNTKINKHHLNALRREAYLADFGGLMIFFGVLLILFVAGCHKDQDPTSPYDRFLCIEIEGEASLYCCPEGSKDDAECWLEDREPVVE